MYLQSHSQSHTNRQNLGQINNNKHKHGERLEILATVNRSSGCVFCVAFTIAIDFTLIF